MEKELKMDSDPFLSYSGINLRSLLLENAQLLHNAPNTNRLNNRVVAPSAVSKTDFPDTTIVTQEKEKEQNDDVWGYLEAQAAFLGPSLWENSDLKVECLDLEEFLTENGIPLNDGNKGRSSTKEDVAHNKSSELPSTGRNTGNQKSDDSQPGPSNSPIQPESVKDVPSNDDESSSSSSGSSAYQSITPALVSPRATNRRKRISVSVASFNDNISDDGSYVPGLDFDPKNRSFSQEELRPQPMSKKSKKQYVPEDLKDDKYWARRNKNNMAAKRSRDARRSKENQIAMRAAFLEKENAVLKAELDKVTKLYAAALKRLEQYEKPGKK